MHSLCLRFSYLVSSKMDYVSIKLAVCCFFRVFRRNLKALKVALEIKYQTSDLKICC